MKRPMTLRRHVADRCNDEMLLSWIKARAEGMSSSQVARLAKVTPERVRTATSRVMQADLDESGEPARVVAAFYWDCGKAPMQHVSRRLR